MTTYTIYYKKQNGLFWHKIKKVKGDGLVENGMSRYIVLEKEMRIEIPCSYLFKFSKERFFLIKERMSEEAGQEINTIK